MYSPQFGEMLIATIRHASEYHDLGKLDELNQDVLSRDSKQKLPLNHEDAGVAHLLSGKRKHSRDHAALLVYSHHTGMPSIGCEGTRNQNVYRKVKDGPNKRPVRDIVDERLADYQAIHDEHLRGRLPAPLEDRDQGISQTWLRIALSCLVDADHGDTARNYRQAPSRAAPHPPSADRLNALVMPLEKQREDQARSRRWGERLSALNSYVETLSKGKDDSRTRLRGQVYAACRDAETSDPLRECDSPVGTGKTTAVMAHLLRAAQDKALRRIFIILPFTNIIDQSVEVYRKCLVLPGEDPESVVAAVHHRAEYQDPDSRSLAALWDAPIIVTTAVQFFETLASKSTCGLRKLHALPGSAVFIDESHAALPAKLWPQAWAWIKGLAEDWGCHFVLGSGSLNRVWTIRKVDEDQKSLSRLVEDDFVKEAADKAERERLIPQTRKTPLQLHEFIDWLGDWDELPGPRLVIVNTVQIAAEVARQLAERDGLDRVMHLSTALTPHDRSIALKRIKSRLRYRTGENWTLVATSCVEAGVDFSFRTGLRQRASLVSLLQTAGRVNRDSEFEDAALWDFDLAPGGLINTNPAYEGSARILGQFFQANEIKPEFCTKAMEREILETGRSELFAELRKAEAAWNFPEVDKLFRVIDAETVTAVVSRSLQERIDKNPAVDWREIQSHSVQIYHNRVAPLGLVESMSRPDLFYWKLPYDDFLGYMKGALPVVQGDVNGGFIV